MTDTTVPYTPNAEALLCPYPGLASFDAGSARWFFGRERAVTELLRRVDARLSGAGPLVVVGASGAGKSSLLRAGLLPALARGEIPGAETWPQILMTPTDHPLRELAARLGKAAGMPVLATVQLDAVISDPSRFTAALAEILAMRPGAAGPRRVALVIDQFEELFTLVDDKDEEERRTFVRAICAAAAGLDGKPPPAVVILGIRADFYGRCAAYPDLLDAIATGHVLLGSLNAIEVRDAVVRPAEATGLTADPGLVELLLDDLGVRGSDPRATIDPGSLPLLAHALLATWRHREATTLTVAGYLGVGRLHGAIAATAEQTFASFDAAGQDAAWQLLLRMVRIGDGVDDTRRRVRRDVLLSEVTDPQQAAGVLEALITARLVTVDIDSVQLAHEALLRSWPRLREWIDIDQAGALTRQQVTEAAEVWNRHNQDTSYLIIGNRLAAAREWVETTSGNASGLSPDARAFLDASIAREQTEQRAARRRGRLLSQLVAVLCVLVLLATSAFVFALHQRSTAAAARDRALSQRIAGQATALRQSNPTMAAQLSLAAYRIADTAESRGSVLSSFNAGNGVPTRYLGGHTGSIGAVAYSPNGKFIATGSDDWTAILWDAQNPARRTPLATLRGHTLAVKSVAFSRDSRILAVGSDDRTTTLWNVSDPAKPRQLATLPPASDSVFALAFSPATDLLATGGYDNTVRLWDVSDPARPGPLGTLSFPPEGKAGLVRAVAFSPDGRYILTGDEGGPVCGLWDVSDPGRPTLSKLLQRPNAPSGVHVRAVAFSPDGRSAVIGEGLGNVDLFTGPGPGELAFAQTSDTTSPISSLAFSPDNHTIAVNGSIVDLFDTARLSTAKAYLTHGEIAWAVAFSPDGRSLATGTNDSALRTWEIPGPGIAPAYGTVEHLTADGHSGTVAVATDKAVQLWNIEDPYRPQLIIDVVRTGDDDSVTRLALRPDGRVLAVITYKKIILYNIADPRHPTELASADVFAGTEFTRAVAYTAAFSRDGMKLAVGGVRSDAPAPFVLFDVSDPGRPRALPAVTAHRFGVSQVAFSPDGKILATASTDRSLKLWRIGADSTITPLTTINSFRSGVRTVSFAPDGRTLVASSDDSTVRLWDVSDPVALRPRADLLGYGAGIYAIAYSPDGRFLATGGTDPSVKLWDVSDPDHPTLTGTLQTYISAAEIAFAADGRTVFATTGFGQAPVWDLDVSRVAERICARAGQGITEAEWRQFLPDRPFAPPCG